MSEEKNAIAVGKHLQGVGGWLGFLVFGLLVLGPLTGYSRLIQEEAETLAKYPELATNQVFQHFTSLVWLSFKIGFATSIAAGFMLWKLRTKRTIFNVILILWSSYFATSAIAAYAVSTLPNEGDWGTLVGQFIGQFVLLSAWTAYLVRSKRVKNTYNL